VAAPSIDKAFREQVHGALLEHGEVLVIVAYTNTGGAKDWFLATDHLALDRALARVRSEGAGGRSDRVEVYATGEFPYRGDAATRDAAQRLLEEYGEVAHAVRHGDDSELSAVWGADDAEGIAAWFAEFDEGERLLGPHPYRHADDAPDTFVAYGKNASGEVVPGAY
jgi:hypothetical protein